MIAACTVIQKEKGGDGERDAGQGKHNVCVPMAVYCALTNL